MLGEPGKKLTIIIAEIMEYVFSRPILLLVVFIVFISCSCQVVLGIIL